MNKSGWMEEMECLSGVWRAVVEQGMKLTLETAKSQNKTLHPAMAAQIREAFVSVFDVPTLNKMARQRFASSLSLEDMKQVLHWLDSPLGRKITEIEVNASKSEQRRQPQEAGAVLGESFNPERRRALTARLVEDMDLVESNINILRDTGMAIALAARAALTPEDFSLEDVRREVTASMAPLRQVVAGQVWVEAVVTYRELSDGELSQYLEFLRTPAGKKYLDARISAINEALVETGRRTGEEIARIVSQKVAEAAMQFKKAA